MRDDKELTARFCALIENNPVIYDYNRPDYCNRNVQDQAWSIIARTLNETDTDCKARWSNIRNRYAKNNKSKLLPSGSAAKVVKEYYLTPHLHFLDGYLKSRPSKSNLPTNPVQTDDSDAGEDSMSPYQPPSLSPSPGHPSPLSVSSSKKGTTITLKEVNQSAYEYFTSKRLRGDNEKQAEPLDTDLSFLQSMLPEMKAMNLVQKRRFKMGIMQLATRILDENEETSTSTSTTNTASSACISQCNTVPYYASAPPIQQTFQNVTALTAPQQTVQNMAPPPVLQQTTQNNPPAAPQHAFQNVATPASPRSVASSSVFQNFGDSRQDGNPTYFNLSPYSVISVSSTHSMPNTQYYNKESPSSISRICNNEEDVHFSHLK